MTNGRYKLIVPNKLETMCVFLKNRSNLQENAFRWLCEKTKQIDVSHRKDVLHSDDKDIVGNQEVPVVQDLFDGFE